MRVRTQVEVTESSWN